MDEYQIGAGFITDQTDFRLATAAIAYEIEKANINNVNYDSIEQQIEKLKRRDQFPSNLDYVDSFYDQKSGLSGVAFKDSNTGKVTVGFAGTNLNADPKKDIEADIKIASDVYFSEDKYFSEAHKFLNNISKNYEIDIVTGHSKGGRDAMILGISHNIPSIVTYNSAPLSNLIGTTVVDATKNNNNEYEKIEELMSDYTKILNNLIKAYDYDGHMEHYVTNNDPLNSITRMFGSMYPGETIEIQTGSHNILKGHDLENFSSGQGGMNYRMSFIDKLENILVADGSVTSAQKIFLDANRALAVAFSFRSLMLNERQELEETYEKWIQEAKKRWKSVKKSAHDIGKHLSVGEELSALESVGCTQSAIETEPIQKLTQRRAKVKTTIEDCEKLIDQYKSVIQHQVKTDQELSRMFR